MLELLRSLFDSHEFMPHGHCYFWRPGLVWLHVLSDGLTGLAYMTIPFTLLYFVRRRRDIPFGWMFACFGAFIVACGATHFMEIWTLWTPNYWLSGGIKAVTAIASVVTAALLVRLVPQALALPAPAEMRAVNAALVLSSRAKTEFLATMSHELRTPLNSILGFSELLLDGQFGAVNESQQRFASNIHQSGKHLLSLIDELLDLSKIEAGKMTVTREPCEAGLITAEAIVALAPQAEVKQVQVTFERSDSTPALADPLRYKQAIYNLLSNAIEFTPPGGRIVVRCGPAPGGRFIRTEVSDTGPGIQPSDVQLLFRPFAQVGLRAQRTRIGTGLGLAITKQLVELMAGRVGVESTVGEGATFYVDIPLAA